MFKDNKYTRAYFRSSNPQFGRPRTKAQKKAQSERMTGARHPLFASQVRLGQSERSVEARQV